MLILFNKYLTKSTLKRVIIDYNEVFMRKILASITSVALLASISACNESTPMQAITKTEFIFDTAVTISIYDQKKTDIVNDIFDFCRDYENKFSKTIKTSEVSKLNNAGGETVTVSNELLEMLEASIEISKLSGGLFDITVYPLSEIWTFSAFSKVPTQENISNAISTISYENILIEGNDVTLLNGAKIDLGAIAKGQIADLIKAQLVSKGVDRGIISIGGNIVTLGLKNGTSLWTVGIQEPFAATNDIMLSVTIGEKNVVTSGPYERNFTYDGVLYHHILNPYTGYPADMDLYSVSIISDDAMLSDALSTTCYLLGYEKSIELLSNYEGVHAVFITNEYEILTTEGIEEEIIVTIY